MTDGVIETIRRARTAVECLGRRAYHRIAAVNYERRLISRRNRTPAGSVRCLEPINRHGTDEMLAELDDVCGPDAVVFDVGAHVGIYVLALASGTPDRRVVAFEPSPPVVARLRANVCLNSLEDRIDVRPIGIGDEDGDRPFYRSSNPELSAFDRASATRWGGSVIDVRRVPIRTLDTLVLGSGTAPEEHVGLEEPNCPVPDAIKIDVEGTAPAVLRGARGVLERFRPVLFVEIHDAAIDGDVPEETKGVLEANGYAVVERSGYWRCEPRG
ncbi:FkbM family methyltransferase [Natrialba swarupiae]|uniref:FkbM family methyltransferase n=1 Tax=Natrialba swarupiae TaxID=2448032 RepID=UPI001EE44AAF|nr:FkbM family methyltransferase [Natrialba swarupiae]